MPRETPLIAWHRQQGARLVDFAGWSLPVSYQAGIIAEHLACRRAAGLFDTSHMGRLRLRGSGALAFLRKALTNDADRLAQGEGQYTLISDPQGRPLDDAYLFRLASEDFLLVVNASNREKDLRWLHGLGAWQAGLRDQSAAMAMLALQGPVSTNILAQILGAEGLPGRRNQCAWLDWRGAPILVSRTGYTGEPHSYELFADSTRAEALARILIEAGAPLGLLPCGLGARDTLRLEAGLPLYGHELRPERPILSLPLARRGVDLAPERGDFVGRAALQAQAGELAKEEISLVPCQVRCLVVLERGMVREGSPVLLDGRQVGELSSGTTVPAWSFAGGAPGEDHFTRPLGMACLERQARPGQMVEVVYRGRSLPALIVKTFMKTSGDFLSPLTWPSHKEKP